MQTFKFTQKYLGLQSSTTPHIQKNHHSSIPTVIVFLLKIYLNIIRSAIIKFCTHRRKKSKCILRNNDNTLYTSIHRYICACVCLCTQINFYIQQTVGHILNGVQEKNSTQPKKELKGLIYALTHTDTYAMTYTHAYIRTMGYLLCKYCPQVCPGPYILKYSRPHTHPNVCKPIYIFLSFFFYIVDICT